MPAAPWTPDDPFLDLYKLYAGTSEVPPQYHLWCGLQAVAAAVSNRVWLAKGAKRLAPNLYVSLIGPSGIGKNDAIDTMLDLVREQPIAVLRGKITAPQMLRELTKAPRHFFVMPELSWSMGHGDWANMLIKQLTEIYGGATDPLYEGTVTGGVHRIPAGQLCINWISGSTYEWLVQCVPADAISGGFFGRIVVIPADYNFSVRYPRPLLHPDHEALAACLRDRLVALTTVEGPFTVTPAAAKVDETWYLHRHAPEEPDFQAAWRRQHDLVLKLAMLLSLCQNDALVIDRATMAQAQQISGVVLRKMGTVINQGALTPESRGVSLVSTLVRDATSPVAHSYLLKRLNKAGLGGAAELYRILQTLRDMHAITSAKTETGGRAYQWRGSQKKYVPEGGGTVIPLRLAPEDDGAEAAPDG